MILLERKNESQPASVYKLSPVGLNDRNRSYNRIKFDILKGTSVHAVLFC